MPSAQGWLQGLYPPVGENSGEEGTLGAQRLRNGTEITAPLGGYQLIPVQTVTTGTASEYSAWVQGAGNCANAIASSNAYFASPGYGELLEGTKAFYESLAPVVNGTFGEEDLSYKNAYASACSLIPNFYFPFPWSLTLSSLSSLLVYLYISFSCTTEVPALADMCLKPLVYDLINVALIHNSTTALSTLTPPIPLSPLLPRRNPRAQPRLQRHGPHPRHRRLNPRSPDHPSPKSDPCVPNPRARK